MDFWRLARLIRERGAVWHRRTVELQSLGIASAILVCAMAILGVWVDGLMKSGAMQRAAGETVLNMDSFIKPLLQDLAHRPTLPVAAQEALSAVLRGKALGQNVAAIKIWSAPGTIVYSDRQEVIGQTYPITDNLRQAFEGFVIAEFDDLNDEENEYERSLGKKFLEIYAPVREAGSERIIAVAEFYETHDRLRAEMTNLGMQSWVVFGSLSIAMIALLSGVTLRQQRMGLEKQVVQLSRLLAENRELQCRVQNAQHRMAEINEQFLRRVSADLHDAPAQLIGFALLRLDALSPQPEECVPAGHATGSYRPSARSSELEAIRGALIESLKEIRDISAGLTLPELVDLSLAEALGMAASRHARRTGTAVDCDIGDLPSDLGLSMKTCLYRCAQEALNNAFRHAAGRGQALRAHGKNGLLQMVVSDYGPAPGFVTPTSRSRKLGLAGLRDRVESLGGTFGFQSHPGQGSRLTVHFKLANVELHHG